MKQFLHSKFTIKDLGEAKYFLGIEIARGEEGTVLCQRKYVLDIINNAGLTNCKAALTPLPPGVILSQTNEEILDDPELYRRLIEQLLYLNFTRPDLSHTTQQLSQFVAHPTKAHWKAALHVLRYLKAALLLDYFSLARMTSVLLPIVMPTGEHVLTLVDCSLDIVYYLETV